jgi:hypothetical protein
MLYNGNPAYEKGTYVNNRVTDDNGTVIGVITGDLMNGLFPDGNGITVTTVGKRTL